MAGPIHGGGTRSCACLIDGMGAGVRPETPSALERSEKSVDARLGHLSILFRRARTATNASRDDAVDKYRKTASNDHEAALIRNMDPESRSSGACDGRIFMRSSARASGREGFADGNVDARYARVVHPNEGQQMSTLVRHSDVHVDSDFLGFSFGAFQNQPCIAESQPWCQNHDVTSHSPSPAGSLDYQVIKIIFPGLDAIQ